MRQIAAIFILFSLLYQTFSRSMIMVDYLINTASYAKNCENKAIPKMHCNGRCQMMKKLLLEEKKDQENTERRENLKNEVLSSNSYFTTLTIPETEFVSVIKPPFASSGYPIDRCSDIFHPPQA